MGSKATLPGREVVTLSNVIQRPPRPFLKWAGGKRQLLPELIARVRQAGSFARYHEPFVGGAALYFELAGRGELGSRPAFLSDVNSRLIEIYRSVQCEPDSVIAALREHKQLHSEEHYYATRAQVPASDTDRAARIIYLNRTCFNGLYRENSRGEFNVPMGRYTNPLICDEANLHAASRALSKAKLHCRGFQEAAKDVKAGDFVYFDPPYDPLSATSVFTSYHQDNFGTDEQRQLAETFRTLHERGAKLLLSNSDTPLIRALYADFTIEEVQATRNVNSRADRRGKITELLVRNY